MNKCDQIFIFFNMTIDNQEEYEIIYYYVEEDK